MAMIEGRDLHVRYAELRAVSGSSLSVAQGEVFGLLGPNGVGKPVHSPVLRVCSALLEELTALELIEL